MNKITFPLRQRMTSPKVAGLQDALHLLLERNVLLANDAAARRELAAALKSERVEQSYGSATARLVSRFQQEHRLQTSGEVDEATAGALNTLLKQLGVLDEEEPQPEQSKYEVKGTVCLADGLAIAGVNVRAVDRDLRSEQALGETRTDRNGFYRIGYTADTFRKAEKGGIDLVVKVIADDGSLWATSPILFNAPPIAEVDLTVPAEMKSPLSLFERIALDLPPLLDGMNVVELEENEEHQDLSFLSGETGFEKAALARFVLAARLEQLDMEAPFWFAILGGSFFQYDGNQSLSAQWLTVKNRLPSLDALALRKSLNRTFKQQEIPVVFRKKAEEWIEAFLKLVATLLAKGDTRDAFVKSALEDAGITSAKKQESFARLFNKHKVMGRDLLAAIKKEGVLDRQEIADLTTSFTLNDLTRADFSVIKQLKKDFSIRQPEQIRKLAKQSEAEWVNWVTAKHAAGAIALSLEMGTVADQMKLPITDMYGMMLERQFREAFPTSAFAGGLERAIKSGGARGLRHASSLSRFIENHDTFELLNTSVDEFLENKVRPEFKDLAKDAAFVGEVKAAQRVFKLAPTFEATDTLLADDLHAAQKIYRLGESEFVNRYEKRPGFTKQIARKAWNRAADTHAATLTLLGDLKAFGKGPLPGLPDNIQKALAKFPNWNNLFESGDLCECEHCRSVLSPAAYFADILVFLKDRKSSKPKPGDGHYSARDILFARRPDLGWLELNCANALTTLPYIDVVCEVLEEAIDVGGENALELQGFSAVPADSVAAKAAVAQAFTNALADPLNQGKEILALDADFSLSQVDDIDPDKWVVHGSDVTYLLEKNGPSPNFFARILHNTKASASELRAYPQYANPKVYKRLSKVKSPLSLPFDLFAEEVRAVFQKTNTQRWDLMQTLRGNNAPNNPTQGEIAAECFGINTDASAASDEKRLIFVADTSVTAQQQIWGETGGNWLVKLSNVEDFLRKTGLDYNELLALLDLPFINPDKKLTIAHLDTSCDTEKKVIQNLNAKKLDRIHRFLRLRRKLNGWQMWELDLVLRHKSIGNAVLDEDFLINLFYFCQLKTKLGAKATVEHVCALFGPLNTETRFTKMHQQREGALYQNLFLNKRLLTPVDPAFQLVPGSGELPGGQTITGHQTVILAALGIREADLVVIQGLTKSSDDTPYITDNLTLKNLSFLWRHVWFARLLKFTAEEWKTVLKVFQQDLPEFAGPKAAWEFLERIDCLKADEFTPDELNWLLAADRLAKAATKEADVARFLSTLRKELQDIQSENAPERHDFLNVTPPTDVDSLTSLLTLLLQKLNRDEATAQFFVAILKDEVHLETTVAGLGAGFDFPTAIKNDIRIRYDEPATTLRFTGLMTTAERTRLLHDPTLAAVIGIAAYQDAIDELFNRPRLTLKFYDPIFIAPLEVLPPTVSFKTQLPAALALKISFDSEQRLLRFAGILAKEEKTALVALSADADYRIALDILATQPEAIAAPDERIWLLDADLLFPLNDPDPANGHLAENLALAVTRALTYLSKTLSEGAVVQQAAIQLGLTAEITRFLLTRYAVLPDSIMTHFTQVFATTTGVVDYAALKTTFDSWFWLNRVAVLVKKWQVTLVELKKILALTAGAQLFDLLTLPLDDTRAIASFDHLSKTSHLLRLRDSLPESEITFLEVLEKLNNSSYAAEATVNPSATEQQLFSADVQLLNEAWLAADTEALIDSLDLSYPKDFFLPQSWERLRRSFYFLEKLNAGTDTVKTFAAPAMGWQEVRRQRELLRSKLGLESWLSLGTEIQDVLRERKRDALAAYLLIQPPPEAPSGKWESTNDLYAYYLLDVEMSSCQLTSRLVQGAGSLQLFVQRCFMGLEPNIKVHADGDTGDSAWRWWKWMRKYRVWEANRKVFLWPENWIEPELKKDRSPFFKNLENELLQNEINQYSVETAFTHYLEKLDGIAQLEIAGFYQEDDGDNTILHVFGRTPGAEPHLYYYRRYDYRQWTPWEKVELDIQGDYLIPAVVNKRLFLFWPVFTEVPYEAGNETMSVPSAGDSTFTPTKTQKKLRLQMAVSDYRQGQWTPKRISKDAHESVHYDMEIVKKHYRFIPVDRSEVDGRFGVKYDGTSLGSDGSTPALLLGAFEISGCKGIPERTHTLSGNFAHAIRPESDATGDNTAFLKWLELGKADEFGILTPRGDTEQDFTLENYFSNLSDQAILTPVLMQTPDFFKMSPPWHLSYLDRMWLNGLKAFSSLFTFGSEVFKPTIGTWMPFFYSDKKRTFFVLPSLLKALSQPLSSRKDLVEGEDSQHDGNTRHYYPEIKEFFRQQQDYFKGAVLDKVNDELAKLAPAQRQQVEQYLYKQFSETSPPPYTDEQVKDLATRFFMRFVHFFLGAWSLQYFQFRQFHFKNFYHPFVCDFKKLVYNPLKGIPALMSRDTQLKNTGFSFYQTYQPTLWVVEDIPLRFSLLDIRDLASLALKLQQPQDGVSTYIQGNLSTATQQALADFQGSDSNPDPLQTWLVEDLNALIGSESIYNALRFSGVVLRPKTLLLMALSPIGDWLIRLNRLLLEDAFPREISRERDAYPKEDVDFTPDGAYSPYNWELFYHAPLLIANSLSKNQRFEEARDWYHFIFNPLAVESAAPGGSPMSKYWITKPFYETTQPEYIDQRIDNILQMLAGDSGVSGTTTKTDLEKQVVDWRTNPFEPHRIANYRTVAYQKTVVMKYLDNLIAWGDYLFRQDSMESINEATQLYILAAEILGPPPKKIPPQAKPPVESFNELEKEFDAFANALVQVENLIPVLSGTDVDYADTAPLPMLYFCIPHNEKMLGYWDTVADRLYKIRHCMNIEGVVRQLSLFEPPIDPSALVKAVAAGVDISSALTDLNAPLPLYRFNVLLQKANEVCNDVKALGSAFLSALEKKDAEALSLLRQGQEICLFEAIRAVRERQIDEVKENLESLKRSKVTVEERRDYYRDIENRIAKEQLQADKLNTAHGFQEAAQGVKLAASIISILPAIDLGASGFGGTPIAKFKIGGLELGQATDLAAEVLSFLSLMASNDSAMASTEAGFERRWDDWKLQERLADKDLDQLDSQIAAAELRVSIAEKELENHILQIENAKATDEFMRAKYTNFELYQWQVGQISGVYFQSYKLAYDLAKRAERCLRFELGVQDSNYIQFGYWDSLRKGLLSGEKLQYDLRRLETAYLEQSRREFELTKHISLALLDPLALVQLKETGRSFFNLSEEIFDLDFPGHYFRRIKSVSLTLPCVAGPYTTISCTLRLLKNCLRINTANGDNGYPRNIDDQGLPADDARFIENNIPVRAIAASNAQNDSGVFELSFRDERYLPFEGAGVVSQWSFELFTDLPANNPNPGLPDFGKPLRQFNYDTISDVVLHLKYTAREDAGVFKNGTINNLRQYFRDEGLSNSLRMFNLRQEFTEQWHRFLFPTNPDADNVLELEMTSNLFPLRDQGKILKIQNIWLLARCREEEGYSVVITPSSPEGSPVESITMVLARVKINEYGDLHFSTKSKKDIPPLADITIDFSPQPVKWLLKMTGPNGKIQDAEVNDLLVVVRYQWE